MTSLILLHGASQTPLAWRKTAERLPSVWAVAAPLLHGRNNTADMLHAAETEVAGIYAPGERIVIAAEEAAPVALELAAKGDVAGVLLTDPVFRAGKTAQVAALCAGWFRPRKNSDREREYATREEKISYLRAIAQSIRSAGKGRDRAEKYMRACMEKGVLVRILCARKKRGAVREGRRMARRFPRVEYFTIAGAKSGWNTYAPAQYAANIVEFAEKITAE